MSREKEKDHSAFVNRLKTEEKRSWKVKKNMTLFIHHLWSLIPLCLTSVIFFCDNISKGILYVIVLSKSSVKH